MTGGGIFGGSNKQTTTSSSEPWEGAQPTLKNSLRMANTVAGNDNLWEPYTGSTVVPWSPDSMQAMTNIANNARANMDNRGASGGYNYVLNNGGLTADQSAGLRYQRSIADAGGYNDAMRSAQTGFQNLANAGGLNATQKAAIANTTNLANSQYAITPELQAVLDQTGAQAADQVNLGASAAGRYGSGLHQGSVAKNVGDVTSRAILSDYQNFQARRDAANNNLFQMGQTGQGNVMSALGNIGNIGQTGISNLSGAANSIANLGQQGLNNIGTAYTGLNAPAQDLMTVGAMNEDLATRQMNDKLRIFNESQNLPKQRAEWLNAIGSGAGSLGGTSRQTQPGTNPFLSALGYGASGLGLLGGFM